MRLTCCLIFFGVVLVSPWSEERLSVVTEEWAPYNYEDEGLVKGFSVDLLREIALDLKQPIEIELVPSMRAKAMLEGNPRTMMITMLRTADRESKYKWIGPLGDTSIYFYQRKNSPLVISSLEDAKKVGSIACRQSGLVYSLLRAAGFTNLEAVATSGQSVYEMLLRGRTDLAVSDSPLGVIYLLKQMNYPLDAVVQTPVKIVELPAYIACSKDIPDSEVELWQKSLDRLKKSGRFAEILGSYTR